MAMNNTARAARDKTLARLAVAGCSAFVLAGLGYSWLAEASPTLAPAFPRAIILVTLVKLAGDAVYFALSSSHREMVHLDDYLGNDLFTFYRFGLPLAVVQAYLVGRGLVPPVYIALLRGAGPATLLYLVNRWLCAKANERRRRERGEVPVIRRREGS
jgi:hypothetical protein